MYTPPNSTPSPFPTTGYFWIEGACIYFGGRLEHNDQGALVYNAGRQERTTTDTSNNPAEDVLVNNRAWLCNKGVLHWGPRVTVSGWEVHDSARGAVLFGSAWLTRALVNRVSGNVWNELQDVEGAGLRDLPPVSGFQFYDTRYVWGWVGWGEVFGCLCVCVWGRSMANLYAPFMPVTHVV